jgi:Ca-activated chloride channel family protein
MSFASPLFLVGLLLVPLAIAAAAAAARRRRRFAVRFTAVPALKAAAAAVPLWRRHLPAALALAAVTALVVSLARPQRTVAVPVERGSIMLISDHSRSMMATDVAPDRISAAQKAARDFLGEVPDQVKVGIVTFSSGVSAVQPPTTDRDAVRGIIDQQLADGATATGDALQEALGALSSVRQPDGRREPAAIVLLSDGKTTTGRDPVGVAQEAARLKIPVYTVALGTSDAVVPVPGYGGGYVPVPPDPETMAAIARTSGGKAFRAEDGGRLASIYKQLGSRLATKKERREVTAAFAAGGLFLLMGAAALSTRWAGRLP